MTSSYRTNKKEKKGRGFYPQPFIPDDFELKNGCILPTRDTIFHVRGMVERMLNSGEIRLYEPRVGCPGLPLFSSFFSYAKDVAKRTLFVEQDFLHSLPRSTSSFPHFTLQKQKKLKKKKPKKLILPASYDC